MDVSIAGMVFRQFRPASDRIVIHGRLAGRNNQRACGAVAHAVMACKSTHQARGDSLENIIRSA